MSVVDKVMRYGIMRAAGGRSRQPHDSHINAPREARSHPTGRFPMRHKALATMLILAALCAGPGCVYRLAIQQGNIAEPEDVEQVQIGMTPSQVRFLLGTPLVDDPFSSDRWDYIYYVRVGREEPQKRHFLTVYFEDGKVSRLVTRDEPPTE